ncbi:hypothetical protein JTE90_011676 [Oedothorax gibbosus]|uniref:Cytosolic carboxypeptidase-like protein 5 n=1 Tax=Oedothorax gibbosus TaxID=931172 RepID=A0AAV6UVP2_9ARAC|nr:hypothetical protein JTE90_011676 [Oedothorax gibbosus]
MKIECGGLTFTSDFDSGNLDRVEYVEPVDKNKTKVFSPSGGDSTLPPIINRGFRRQKSHPESPVTSPVHSKKYQLKKRALYSKLKSTVSAESVCAGVGQTAREFRVWTRPDCSGTSYQTTFRTWFYFGITGGPPGLLVRINVMNLNRQGKLYFHGMKPVYKIVPSKDTWKRIPGKVDYKCATDGNFTISFCHILPSDQESVIYFAFTYPFSYSECQHMLDEVDEKLGSSLYISKSNKPPESALYYCRELLCRSSEGNKVELLTITSCKGLTSERETRLPDLFPEVSKPRCHVFQNKKVVFISSRVHPGETPSSFVLNGMLHYLLHSRDCAALRLRNLFVFKLIPMLNPDGVQRGHYRADTRGLNLNRIYMVSDPLQHPSIHAARTLLLHYHTSYATPGDPPANKSSTNQKRFKNSSTANMPGKSPKKIVKKAPIRKHPLVACDTLTQNLNFLSSVPVGLTSVDARSEENSPAKSFLPDVVASSLCQECKVPDFQSKKTTLEDDRSCNCIEPSEADDSSSFDCEARLGEGDASKLLKDVPCLKPEESGIAYYFDLHGHASKRGCFIYGNYFPDIDKMVDCMFLPKLMSINCPYFDFAACNFSPENMYSGSNSNVQSKEGSGRVSLYVLTGIIHSYTLECNYNTCRFTPNQKRPKRPTGDVPSQVFFTPEIYQQIGESLLVSILDVVGCNPRSQISSSQFLSVQGVKEWLKQHALSLRGRCAPTYVRKVMPVSGSKVSDKVLTRSMTIRRSLFSPSNKGLRQDSSSSPANHSSTDSERTVAIPAKTSRHTSRIRATRSLLSSPVSKRTVTLQRRHTFVQDAAHRFRKPFAPSSGRSSTA